jgi:hypothetical protein
MVSLGAIRYALNKLINIVNARFFHKNIGLPLIILAYCKSHLKMESLILTQLFSIIVPKYMKVLNY